ncbi:hypothetical protein FOB35_00895 (plasmid) [Klebsiella variicola]|nr:hypothetical protein FOB35_00895 [Klebsiella variicola]
MTLITILIIKNNEYQCVTKIPIRILSSLSFKLLYDTGIKHNLYRSRHRCNPLRQPAVQRKPAEIADTAIRSACRYAA